MARLANSLVKLRDQVNAAYPNRNKASDGWIGNAAHAASASDHNPNIYGVVNALDITHDPANGLDVHALADRLRVNRHPNLRYIISNSRIASAGTGWNWVKYLGSNPHNKHAHFSVGQSVAAAGDGKSTSNYDDGSDWNIKGASAPQGGNMPTKLNTGLRRIIHSEMEGWPYEDVHNGKFDSQFLASWPDSVNLEDMIWEKWNKNAPFRNERERNRKFYEQYTGVIADLPYRPTKAQLDEAMAKLAEEAKKTEQAKAEAEATRLALAAEQANKTQDTKLLDQGKGFMAWVTQLLNRLKG